MPALKPLVPGKKKLLIKNEDQLRMVFSRTFSERFYEKVATPLLKYFKIKPDNIARINQYASDDKGHSFLTVFFKVKGVIPASDVKKFTKFARTILREKGYTKTSTNAQEKLFGSSRKAVEIPLIWKSKLVGGCYCLFFERFS